MPFLAPPVIDKLNQGKLIKFRYRHMVVTSEALSTRVLNSRTSGLWKVGCCFVGGDIWWSFARLIAPVVAITSILGTNKTGWPRFTWKNGCQNGESDNEEYAAAEADYDDYAVTGLRVLCRSLRTTTSATRWQQSCLSPHSSTSSWPWSSPRVFRTENPSSQTVCQ